MKTKVKFLCIYGDKILLILSCRASQHTRPKTIRKARKRLNNFFSTKVKSVKFLSRLRTSEAKERKEGDQETSEIPTKRSPVISYPRQYTKSNWRVMHNWLEGILQGHFCYHWRFGCVPSNQAKKKHRNDSRANSGATKRARISIEMATMDINDKGLSSKSDDCDDKDILLNGGPGGGFFSEYDVESFHTQMKQVVLPPDFLHLPLNLGEVKHGKFRIQLTSLHSPTCSTQPSLCSTHPAKNVFLADVVEFPGKQLIGFFMITCGCRLQRLMADLDFNHLTQLATISGWYITISLPRRHCLLSGLVTPVQSINCDGVVVGTMPPWNCVVANVGGKMLGEEKEFLVILTISNIYPNLTKAIPTHPFGYLLFLFGMVVGKVQDDEEALLPSQVVSLAVYWLLDKVTVSIHLNGIALIQRGYDVFLNISGHQ
ncbi:hypothetical protein VP01_1048g3 [Puccinia sorghi]|uniref:Uncharacterized protein n=1 Tax=Puccinia sorghi TaxID=27349 RepID=A0A0L6VUB8_9BASI|nr:hypothetical protein VP01_1048g3 [Puccinia sorghi]